MELIGYTQLALIRRDSTIVINFDGGSATIPSDEPAKLVVKYHPKFPASLKKCVIVWDRNRNWRDPSPTLITSIFVNGEPVYNSGR